jgi:hypothetical protein
MTPEDLLVMQMRSREDYPINANYEYWSQNHSKTIEARQYLSKLHENERHIK